MVNAQSRPVVPSASNPVQNFQMEQSDQLWIEVQGDDGTCTIRVSWVRLWNGVEEMTSIHSNGADWARKHIVEALYREVDANL